MARCFKSAPALHFFLIVTLTTSLVVPVIVPITETAGQTIEGESIPSGFANGIRPILVARCFGCHQTARSNGGFVMTDFQQMIAGGESGLAAIVPGDPDKSYLVELITTVDGKAQMPPDEPALSAHEIEAIRAWITAGAIDDSQQAKVNFSADHPPVYNCQPSITSMDYSPDGNFLAVSGFHEVLLVDTASLTTHVSTGPSANLTESTSVAQYAGRLIGLSPRIESVRFSPDGLRIAVAGGNPGEFGEVQIWNVAERKLELSRIIGDDTIDGVSWSPDSKLVSFGCKDTTLRVIDASTGQQVLFQGAHDDWIRDTVFSADGQQLVSVGRDMSCKLTEVPTQRFVDNITSITPGVLKGGIACVDRHPTRDEIVIGGADGIPKVYRMNRITKRVIGDDANLVRLLPAMPGRINSIAVSRDGRRIIAASSLDGKGFARIYSYEFDPAVSEELKAILAKLPESWSPEERQKVDTYNTADVRQIAALDLETSGLYSVAWNPDGKSAVVAGNDGQLRVIDAENGLVVANANLVTAEAGNNVALESKGYLFDAGQETETPETKLEYQHISVFPAELNFDSPLDYLQVVVSATRVDGSVEDVTRFAKFGVAADLLSRTGSLFQPIREGVGELVVSVGAATANAKVNVDFADAPLVPDFRNDVNPVMTKLGCNAGTCHGSADGKKGFKLSLRGYDPEFDVRALTDDMGARRINHAWPEQSLMLLKPSAGVAHAGGQVFKPGDRSYQIIRDWITGGAKVDMRSPRVASIELFPPNPVLDLLDAPQQFRVVATMADGQQRDVTREAFIEVGNTEVASISGSVVRATRRGETPILARYNGAYTATTLTVMGNRDGFVWSEPEMWTEVDRFVADKWNRMKIQPSDLCSDSEFVRRVYLDLTGLPPDSETTQKFIDDTRATRIKRDELVDSLVGNAEYVEHWSNKWADLLQVNRKYLGAEGAVTFRAWIRDQVANNRPYNEFAYEILTATGSNRLTPAASYFKIHRTPVDTMENTTHLFLATRFNCNKCHDHPFERWTQNQYFETASFFSQVSLERDDASGDMTIGGSAIEGATPLYEIVGDNGSGLLKHDRTGNNVEPKLPFECNYEVNSNASRRVQLASWVTSPDNPYFATSYANRLWGYLMGTGLIEPLDDIRAGNPPANPRLLEYLTHEFVANQFNVQHMIKLICKSRVYQLSIVPNKFNSDDILNYSHAKARRLPAEVLFDSIYFVTGSQLLIPGVAPGTRAAALPDSGVSLPSGFLATLGRPARESVCECERSSELQLGSVLAMVSGPDVARAINDPESALARLVNEEPDDRRLIEQIYMRVLNRLANDEEVSIVLNDMALIASDHTELVAARDERQLFVTQHLPELEQQRVDAIVSATGQLEARIAEVDPTLPEKEAAHAQANVVSKQALDEYEASENGFVGWQRRQLEQVHWAPMTIAKFESAAGRVAKVMTDRSLLISGAKGKDVYTVLAATDMSGISAVRLEMLPDDSLASKGPGLALNGNVVLTELQMEIAHPDRPDDWQPAAFASAMANFEQPSFPVTDALDGIIDNTNGWALMGRQGQSSWAVFQLKIPVGYSSGSLIRFKLHQSFDDVHQIGRFRISLTRYDQPIGLGIDEALAAQLLIDETARNEETRTTLRDAFRKSDSRYAELLAARTAAEQPLPIDAGIVALREKLQRVSQPIPPDSMLIRMNADVDTSTRQLDVQRLTASQDLAWALINSPAFLFNR